MQVIIRATEEQKQELEGSGKDLSAVQFCAAGEVPSPASDTIFIDLTWNPGAELPLARTTILHAPLETCAELPAGCGRIIAWPGFLARSSWEIAGDAAVLQQVSKLSWQFEPVPDIPGLVAARVIALIINEAYFAFGEGVSTQEEIDTAMKLGTNYPFGPFEWARRIGPGNIAALLGKMRAQDPDYSIAPLLEEWS